MEVVGFAAGIITLISTVKDCIDLFQYFTVANSPGRDFEILSTKLDVEKALLLQWVDRTRLLQPRYDRRLDDPKTQRAISQVVSSIKLLLGDSQNLQHKYGVREERSVQASTNIFSLGARRMPAFTREIGKLDQLLQEFESMDLRIRGHNKAPVTLRARWAITDKDRFSELLQELSYFVSRLHSLVPDTTNTTIGMIEQDVNALSNQKTIRLLSEGTSERDDMLAKIAEKHHVETCENRILRSVWYRHMNDREDQLDPPNPETFQWALSPACLGEKWDSIPDWLSTGKGVYWVCGKGLSELQECRV